MDIKPNEVESVKVIGNLFGSDVKLVKTHGGFHIAVGKKKKNGGKTEALAAGSHQAIVAHHVSKEFGSDFHPALFKSEHDALEKVEENTNYLPSAAIERGIELFTLSKGNKYEFIVYKRGITLAKYEAEVEGKALLLKSYDFKVNADKEVARALAKSIEDKADDLELDTIEKGWL